MSFARPGRPERERVNADCLTKYYVVKEKGGGVRPMSGRQAGVRPMLRSMCLLYSTSIYDLVIVYRI